MLRRDILAVADGIRPILDFSQIENFVAIHWVDIEAIVMMDDGHIELSLFMVIEGVFNFMAEDL